MNGGQDKHYIGDGVYASHDGYQIWLETSDGIRVTNAIALEPGVFASLVEYEASLRRKSAAMAGDAA
jgi:hypothetical protein